MWKWHCMRKEQAGEETFNPTDMINVGQLESVFMHTVISSAENSSNIIYENRLKV